MMDGEVEKSDAAERRPYQGTKLIRRRIKGTHTNDSKSAFGVFRSGVIQNQKSEMSEMSCKSREVPVDVLK